MTALARVPERLRTRQGRCELCGLAFTASIAGDRGVVQADRAAWRRACFRAPALPAPVACPALQKALRAACGQR